MEKIIHKGKPVASLSRNIKLSHPNSQNYFSLFSHILLGRLGEARQRKEKRFCSHIDRVGTVHVVKKSTVKIIYIPPL